MAREGIDFAARSSVKAVVDGTDTLADGTTGIQGGKAVTAKTGGNAGEYTYPAAGGSIAGVLEHDVLNGNPGTLLVGTGKVVPVIAGAAVAVGVELAVDTAGKFVTAGVGDQRVALADEAAGADGDTFNVRLYPGTLLA